MWVILFPDFMMIAYLLFVVKLGFQPGRRSDERVGRVCVCVAGGRKKGRMEKGLAFAMVAMTLHHCWMTDAGGRVCAVGNSRFRRSPPAKIFFVWSRSNLLL